MDPNNSLIPLFGSRKRRTPHGGGDHVLVGDLDEKTAMIATRLDEVSQNQHALQENINHLAQTLQNTILSKESSSMCVDCTDEMIAEKLLHTLDLSKIEDLIYDLTEESNNDNQKLNRINIERLTGIEDNMKKMIDVIQQEFLHQSSKIIPEQIQKKYSNIEKALKQMDQKLGVMQHRILSKIHMQNENVTNELEKVNRNISDLKEAISTASSQYGMGSGVFTTRVPSRLKTCLRCQ